MLKVQEIAGEMLREKAEKTGDKFWLAKAMWIESELFEKHGEVVQKMQRGEIATVDIMISWVSFAALVTAKMAGHFSNPGHEGHTKKVLAEAFESSLLRGGRDDPA